MTLITAKTKMIIYGTKNGWSLSSNCDRDDVNAQECNVSLEIQGNDKQGYHLIMSPNGFFTADYWYKTKQEAIDEAEELFGVSIDEWSENLSV